MYVFSGLLSLGGNVQDSYYFSKDEQQIGPFTQLEVCRKLESGEITLTDYYFDDEADDWQMAMENSVFKRAYDSSQKKRAKPTQEKPSATSNQSAEWYVLKGENKYGPFSYKEVIKMLQQKKVYEYDYIWNSDLSDWQRVAELEEFSADRIRDVLKSDSDTAEIFFRRRHMRVQYGASLIIHDNFRVWKGESIEISAGGAGLVMHNSTLKPGDEIFLHFKPGDGVPPFNATCEIVSKAFDQEIQAADAPLRYGVRFVSISDEAHLTVKNYVKSVAA